MATRGYGDAFPDTPENPRSVGGFGTSRAQLNSIRPATAAERAKARRYLERVAPDLIDMLGLT